MPPTEVLCIAGCLMSLVACGVSPPTATATAHTTPTSTSIPTSKARAGPPTARPPVKTPSAPQGVALPNAHLTPGATFVGATATQVCTPGWASAHRNVTYAQYHEVYAEYGVRYPEPYGTYELDHLIPLELGGDNANTNLWPEPASPSPGFHQKDDLENTLHDLVCAGSLSLAAAQHAIASNWYAAYVSHVTG